MTADPISAHEGKTWTHEGNNFRLRNCVFSFDPVQATHPESRSRFDSDLAHTLARDNAARATLAESSPSTGTRVRRLTPVECERLQGFVDGHTDVLFRGKPASDSARYRAIGNSMAVPVMRWILANIEGASRQC